MFFGGIAISVALSLPNTRVPILYFADLIGAGISAGLVLLGLNYLGGIQIAFLISLVGLLASATFSSKRTWIWLTSLSIILILLLGLSYRFPKGIIPISPKELKLMLALDANEVQWEYQGWSPLARVDVLSIKGDTLDPNLNISYKLVTHDGGAPSLLLHLPDESKKDAFINRTIFGVPYWINQGPSVLVIGLGGGPDIIAALAADANQIIGAEVNPEMVEIVENHFADFVGDPYSDPSVQIELADGRHLLAKSDQKFDIIQLTGVDTTIATLGANPNLAENYLYTREAFIEYLDHLTETGMLSVSFPNVEGLGLQLLVLATKSLREHRVILIEDHVVMSEMTGYVHVLVKKKSFTTDEIDVLQEHFNSNPTSIYFPLYNRIFGTPTQDFISERRILLAPGLPRSNQYTSYIEALKDGTEHEFLAGQPQTVLPPTDDWPFFFVLDKWGFQSINYDILMLTLFFLLSFLVLLILLPPFLLNRKGFKISSPGLLAVYFGCLGLGFIFVEVIMIQKLSLIVGHPSYSLAITLCALLIASGLGSLISELIPISDKWKAPITASAIAILVLIAYLVLDRFGGVILIQPFGMRVFLSAAIVAVPGLFMGVPFPAGLSIVKGGEPQLPSMGVGIERYLHGHWNNTCSPVGIEPWIFLSTHACSFPLFRRISVNTSIQ